MLIISKQIYEEFKSAKPVNEQEHMLKVGQKVALDGGGSVNESVVELLGIIGEISSEDPLRRLQGVFYVFHNQDDYHGIMGNIFPSSKGCKYSYMIGLSEKRKMKILDYVEKSWLEAYRC